jgi:hypothetical protein
MSLVIFLSLIGLVMFLLVGAFSQTPSGRG